MTNDALSGLDDLSGLETEGELPYLSETIVYERDIKPYPFIGIHAGVGSGKILSLTASHVAIQSQTATVTFNVSRNRPSF